jgi:hypothetical protein
VKQRPGNSSTDGQRPHGPESRKVEVPGRKRLEIDHGKVIRAVLA